MQRVTVTLDDELMEQLDRVIALRGYQNRSEAIRDLARAGLRDGADRASGDAHAVGTLTYVYDHGARDLPRRLVQSAHAHHDLTLATLHVHLDEENCLEVAVLRGPSDDIQQMADHIVAERGVRYGKLVTVPLPPTKTIHKHREDFSTTLSTGEVARVRGRSS